MSWLWVALTSLLCFMPTADAAADADARSTASGTEASWTEATTAFSSGTVDLAGTILLPDLPGARPGVVIVHGSGPETRSPYLRDARMLARHGIAALVFDKRGTGSSTGSLANADLEALERDALAAVEHLRSHPRVASDRVGVLGVSQGGWLAPFLAADDSEVAFFVQVTAASTPLAVQEMWRAGHALARLGYAETDIATAMRAHRLFFSIRPLLRAGIVPLEGIWFETFDPWREPVDAWRRLEVPSLVLLAGDDPYVPSQLSRDVLAATTGVAGSEPPDVVVFPDAGHALGGPDRNAKDAYVDLVTRWIRATTMGDRPVELSGRGAQAVVTSPAWFGPVAERRLWHASAWLHLPLLLVIVLVPLVAAGRLATSMQRGPGTVRRPAVVAVSLLLALAVSGFGVAAGTLRAIGYLLNADASSLLPPVPAGVATEVAAWASLALAVLSAIVAARAGAPVGACRGRLGGAGAWFVASAVAGASSFVVAAYWGGVTVVR